MGRRAEGEGGGWEEALTSPNKDLLRWYRTAREMPEGNEKIGRRKMNATKQGR